MSTSVESDQLTMRARPEGSPVMHQNWENLLFLHWPLDPSLIRAFVPQELEIDTFEGKAWIGITPFAMTGVRLASLPAIPGLDSFLEINVRTYVRYRGKPGIWFFSLDASKFIPAVAARMLFMLPYFTADMQSAFGENDFQFESKRSSSPSAQFRAHWKSGARLQAPDLRSLAFFLVERYGFFAIGSDGVSLTRVYHHPWILEEAQVLACESTMISVLGIPEPTTPPLAHFSRSMNVEVWAPVPA
jgi:uncharacterized protein